MLKLKPRPWGRGGGSASSGREWGGPWGQTEFYSGSECYSGSESTGETLGRSLNLAESMSYVYKMKMMLPFFWGC